MSYSNIYTLNVDLKQSMTSTVPTFKQGETAFLRFRLFDNGHHLDTTPYTYSEIVHKLPSGKKIMGNLDLVTIDGEKLLEYRYTGLEMAKLGKVEVQLVIQSEDTNVAIRPFKVVIVEDMLDDELTYVGALQEVIAEVSLLKEEMYKAINSWVFRNSYDNSTQYYRHNIVEYEGSSWIALRDTKGNKPPTLPTISNMDWYLVAKKAEGGIASVNGQKPDVNGNLTLKASDIGGIGQTDFNNHANLKATTSQYGHTKLNNTLTSTSTIEAATANTVKTLNDRLNTKFMYNTIYGYTGLNINDSNMSSTNFESNILLLFNNLPNRTHWTIYLEIELYPNLLASVRKKLTDDIGEIFDNTTEFLLEFTNIGNKFIPNKIIIYPNSKDRVFYINWDKIEGNEFIVNRVKEFAFKSDISQSSLLTTNSSLIPLQPTQQEINDANVQIAVVNNLIELEVI